MRMGNLPALRCVVVTSFDENQPGFLDFSYRIQALLTKHHVTMILKQPLNRPEFEHRGLNKLVIPSRHGKLGWLLYQWKALRQIRALDPDRVVLLHSALSPMARWLSKYQTCLYWNEHPSNLAHFPERFHPLKTLLTWSLQKCVYWGATYAQKVLPIGEDHWEDLLHHGVSQANICMQYMGVSEAFIPSLNRNSSSDTQGDSGPIKVVYVGTISPSRGRDVMLEAMSLLAQKARPNSLKLRLVGADDEQRQYCLQRIKALQLQDYVSVEGRVAGHEVPSILHAADAAICLWPNTPWNQFNPPTKLFEYLTAGLVVIASNIRTHTRYVQNGKHGLIFEYTPHSLAEALEQLIERRAELPTWKEHARQSGQLYVWREIEPYFLKCVEGTFAP